MLRYFGLTVTTSVLIVGIVLVASVAVTSSRTSSIARDGLGDQTTRHVRDTARELGARVEVQLRGVEDAVTSHLSNLYTEAYSTFGSDESLTAAAALSALVSSGGLAYPIDVPVDGSPRAGNSSLISDLSRDGDMWHGSVPTQTFSDRTGRRGVDDRSCWFIPGQPLAPAPSTDTIDAETNRERRATRSVDVVVARMLEQYPVVLQIFLGMASSGLTRVFPGAPISADYDPRQRPFFLDVVAAEGGQVLTAPYIDAFGNGWLISVVQGIFQRAPGVTPRLVGAFGADIKVDALASAVLNVTFRGSPAAHLTTPDGRVVASPYWDADQQLLDVGTDPAAINAAQAPFLWDLPDSPVTEEEFFAVAVSRDGSAPPAATARTSGQRRATAAWLVAAASVPLHPADRPTESGAVSFARGDIGTSSDTRNSDSESLRSAVHRPRYIVIVHADREEALAPLSELEDRVQSTSVPLLVAIAVGTLFSVLVANGIVWWLARSVTEPLHDMTFVAKQLTAQQAGQVEQGGKVQRENRKQLREAQDRLKTYGDDTQDEVGLFVRAFGRMVEGVSRHAAQAVQTGQQAVPNPMQDGNPAWLAAVDRVIESGGPLSRGQQAPTAARPSLGLEYRCLY